MRQMQQNLICIFTFFYLCNSRENIVMGSNFHNGDFDGVTDYEVTKSENDIFSVWCACIYACVSVISITQKQITAESSNSAIYI